MSIDFGYDPVQRLEELLVSLTTTPPGELPMKVFEMEDGGECPVWSLFEIEGKVSVVHFFMPEGGVFVRHKHDEMECLIPYSGRLVDLMPTNHETFGPNDVLRIVPGQTHRIEALEDTWGIAVAVPSSEGYPHADR